MKVWLLARVDRLVEWAQKIMRALSRLLWRLAFLYTIVTVTAVTLLFGALMFYTSFWNYDTAAVGTNLSLALMDDADRLGAVLEQQPPDLVAAQAWVENAFLGSSITFARPNTDTKDTIGFSTIYGKGTLLAVVDRDGSVVASNLPETYPAGSTLAEAVSPTGAGLVGRALQGEYSPVSQFARADGGLLVSVPVRSHTSSEIVGAVYVSLMRTTQFELFLYVLPTTLSASLVIAVAAAVVGLIFGLITAKSIEKRLKRLAEAVDAWGRGDFSKRIVDRSADEIGELAQEMNKMAAQLKTLVQTRQELAALEERNRLARDLHDSVKQQVFATTMNLGASQALWEQAPEQARERLDVAASLSRQSQQELTQLIRTLRPARLEEKGLAALLTEYLSIWEHNNSISVKVLFPGSLPSLSMEDQELLYRICQEAFANIARHSKATTARLVFESQPGRLTVQISDNGCGFDYDDPRLGGMGLRSMQERVQKLNGTFQVESANTGTTLRITVPLKKGGSDGAATNQD